MRREAGTHWLTFGEVKPCTKAGLTYHLESIDYRHGVKPLAVQTWIRRVHRASTITSAADPLGSAAGYPGRFADDYKPAGAFTRFTAGMAGDTRCKDPSFVEILTSVHYGENGFSIPGFTVHYRIGSKRYSVRNHWEFAACGRLYHPAGDCDG